MVVLQMQKAERPVSEREENQPTVTMLWKELTFNKMQRAMNSMSELVRADPKKFEEHLKKTVPSYEGLTDEEKSEFLIVRQQDRTQEEEKKQWMQ